MPANLPPAYHAAEERFRTATTTAEKIACLEEMLMVMPKHKGTDKLKADIRRRISKLRDEESRNSGRGAGGRNPAFVVRKEGDAQVVVVGPANSGKSALVGALTNAKPEVAEFPMTTRVPTPGMHNADGIHVQFVDTPALDSDYVEPEMVDMIRRCDLVLVVVDCTTDPVHQIEQAAAYLADRRIVAAHRRHLYDSARVLFAIPFLIFANKNDDASTDEDVALLTDLAGESWPIVAGSALNGRGLDTLVRRCVEAIGLIRVYPKPRGKEADRSAPFVLRKGATLSEFAAKVHKDFATRLKGARVWGTQVFDGQLVQRDYVLHDGDIVELHI